MTLPAPLTPTDGAIVRRVLSGDVEAFALLVDRYHARCLRVATAVLGDSDEAEDAVQDGFVRAYKALASYQEREKFGAWLVRIVVNQSRTRAAKHRRWTAIGDGAESEITALADPAAHADDELSRREELAYALAQLGDEHREAILLRFTEEMSYEEMAAATGVGVSALKMRVQRACARLRSLLSENLHV